MVVTHVAVAVGPGGGVVSASTAAAAGPRGNGAEGSVVGMTAA
jgi:hypothetical protein